MSISTRVKGVGSVLLGLATMLGMTAIGLGLLMGAAAFSMWILKWTFPVYSITLSVCIIVLAPLACIPATRGFSAVGFIVASFVIGAILWLWGIGYTYAAWGLWGVVIGLMIFDIGAVLTAMLAALLHGDWGNLGVFIVSTVITISLRVLAAWLAQKADERSARLAHSSHSRPTF